MRRKILGKNVEILQKPLAAAGARMEAVTVMSRSTLKRQEKSGMVQINKRDATFMCTVQLCPVVLLCVLFLCP